jgi:uncharacterized protein
MSEQVQPARPTPYDERPAYGTPTGPAYEPSGTDRASDPLSLSDEEFDARYGDAYPSLRFHQLLRSGPRFGFWWSLLGALTMAFVMLVLAPFLWLVPFLVWLAVTGQDVVAWLGALSTLSDPSPSMLAYLMLTLASLIPAAWFVARVIHGVKPRWLTSVGPRMRWGFFGVCLGLSVVALIATVVVGAVLPGGDTAGMDTTGGANPFTTTTLWFLLVVVLLVPFQAAGEEYLFRGYLTQALGGVFGRVWVAVLVPALLFALAHGSQSVPVFFDRFAFGVVAGLLVVWTGGLEAAIAMHVLNNFLAFGLALAFGDIGSSLTPTGGSWWMIPSTLTQSLVYLGLAVLVARRMGVATRATGRALVASQRRV